MFWFAHPGSTRGAFRRHPESGDGSGPCGRGGSHALGRSRKPTAGYFFALTRFLRRTGSPLRLKTLWYLAARSSLTDAARNECGEIRDHECATTKSLDRSPKKAVVERREARHPPVTRDARDASQASLRAYALRPSGARWHPAPFGALLT